MSNKNHEQVINLVKQMLEAGQAFTLEPVDGISSSEVEDTGDKELSLYAMMSRGACLKWGVDQNGVLVCLIRG